MNDARSVRAWIAEYLAFTLATLDARAIVLGLRAVATVADLDELLAASVFRATSDRQIAAWRALPGGLSRYGNR